MGLRALALTETIRQTLSMNKISARLVFSVFTASVLSQGSPNSLHADSLSDSQRQNKVARDFMDRGAASKKQKLPVLSRAQRNAAIDRAVAYTVTTMRELLRREVGRSMQKSVGSPEELAREVCNLNQMITLNAQITLFTRLSSKGVPVKWEFVKETGEMTVSGLFPAEVLYIRDHPARLGFFEKVVQVLALLIEAKVSKFLAPEDTESDPQSPQFIPLPNYPPSPKSAAPIQI